jgi:hypothetical protein
MSVWQKKCPVSDDRQLTVFPPVPLITFSVAFHLFTQFRLALAPQNFRVPFAAQII